MSALRSIVHPTDFSDLSATAFAHALRIALAARCKLYLLHVSQYDAAEALAFPQAQRLLAQWGLSEEDDAAAESDDPDLESTEELAEEDFAAPDGDDPMLEADVPAGDAEGVLEEDEA